jgi:membrane-associated phospholipid phosphatase
MKKLYEILSLYEFVALVGIGLLAIISRNLYLASLVIFLAGIHIPEAILKKITKDKDISFRPLAAQNCNMLNSGGYAGSLPGFPSGHCMVSGFLGTYTIYEFIRVKNERNINLYELVIIMFLLSILVPYAQMKNKCHTGPQVSFGFILGIFWAGLYVLLEKHWLLNYKKYTEDKKRVEDYFVSGF